MDGVTLHPPVVRRSWTTVAAAEHGMTLIEVVTAMAIFAVVSGGLISLLLATMGTSTLARQRTLAQQAASTQIEQIRNLPYASIGNISGNPPGTIPMTASITISGPSATTGATRTTKISYVNDPTPLSYQSYANYKQVSVTITRNSDGMQLAREVTNIAPPIKASQSQATVVVTVVDSGNNAAVANAQVNIGSGPSGSESDTSDSSGKVTFAGLLPTSVSQPYYDVTVTPPAGYVALKDTQPPATVAHFSLAPGQTQPAAIQIYQPATVNVQLLNSDGTPYVGASSVTVSSTRGSQTFAYTSPQLAVTAINGEPLVPGLNYTVSISASGFTGNPASATVPANYPTNLTSTFAFTRLQMASLTVVVRKTLAVLCNNATVTVSGGPSNLGGATALTAKTDVTGTATFTNLVPVGTGYAISAVSASGKSGSSSTTAIVAGSNAASPITVSAC